MLGIDAALATAKARGLALGFQLFDNGELRHIEYLSGNGTVGFICPLSLLSHFSQMQICQFANHHFAN
ncbi:hypothetical protein TomTYG75_00540 [Sphingobium sp. TomTYG75]